MFLFCIQTLICKDGEVVRAQYQVLEFNSLCALCVQVSCNLYFVFINIKDRFSFSEILHHILALCNTFSQS